MGELVRVVYDRATGRVLAWGVPEGFEAGPTEAVGEAPRADLEHPPAQHRAFFARGRVTWREAPRGDAFERLGLQDPADLRALAAALRPFLLPGVGPP